ncbi:Zn(II)2Cys6 transcription factor [Aspergillus stella-maris]|uniref:Zn(II)2Cys6 transcription factor n=1 Tax=Aspergillus stella-maris TaxID=1810926 RepID=UPI003CCDDF60
MDHTKPPVRAIISCTSCRRKKLRCDRLRPCGSCVKRSLECEYLNPAPFTRNAGTATRSTKQLNQRVKELEELVNVLGKARNTAQPHSQVQEEQGLHDADDAISSSLGRIQVGGMSTSYVSGAHWAALQHSIAEIRECLDDDTAVNTDGPALLLGLCPPANKEDFLAIIPPKAMVDRLVSRFFNSMEPGVLLFHSPTFQKEYNNFWRRPQDISLTWLGMLFSMMCLAIRLHQRSEAESSNGIENPEEACNAFRLHAAYCLIKDRYTIPSKYTIEALLTYAQCEYFRSADAQHENWVMFGVILRLAMHVGLHRDGLRFTGLSCFEVEMRRRVWAFIIQADALSSFQSGLPRMLHKGIADTKLPRNLLDEDFDENTTILPPSRPDTDATPLSYVIAKSEIATAFAQITDLVASTEVPSFQSVIELDMQLNKAHAAIPAHLKFRDVGQSVTDLPYIIMRRYSLEILYQKSRCILHRQYLSEGRLDPIYAKSRHSCIDAATNLLHHQAELDAHIQPGGTLYHSKWFLSSLATHDFILAAMVLCLELHLSKDSDQPEDLRTKDSFLSALQVSHDIWGKYKEYSAEATKAWRSISIMLSKVNATPIDVATPSTGQATKIDRPFSNNGLEPSADRPDWHDFATNRIEFDHTMALDMARPDEAITQNSIWDFSGNIDWLQFDLTVQSLDLSGGIVGEGGEIFSN